MNLLFDIEETAIPDIEGLSYIPDFITQDEERELLDNIDVKPWLHDLRRRVQHYGYKYDYKARTVTQDNYIGPLPAWIEPIAEKLPFKADQAIVNEYEPGQGIAAHIDCVPCFDGVIASLSLAAPVMMHLIHPQTGQKEELYLQPRSLTVLSSAARYDWQHAIPARKSDMVNGFKVQRKRRVSLTFRRIVVD